MMMIHNPATIAIGDHKDMEKAIDMLGEVKESIINAYELKTSQPRKTLSKMMDQTTWMNAGKALELHFIDGIMEDEKKRAPEGYEFSESVTENVLMNKITAKMPMAKAKEEIVSGRRVDELKAALYKKLL